MWNQEREAPWKQKEAKQGGLWGHRESVLVSFCCCYKLAQTCGLKQHTCIIFQFYRAEV